MKKVDKNLNDMIVEYIKDEDLVYLFIEYQNLFEILKESNKQFNINHINEKYSNKTIIKSKFDALNFFKELSINYYNIIKKGIKDSKINIYPINEAFNYKSFWTEEFKGNEPYIINDNIFIPAERNYNDLPSIIHECGHFVEHHYSMYSFRNINLLGEVVSIFCEKLLFYNTAFSYDSLSSYHNRISFDYDCLDDLLEYYVIYDMWINKKLTFSNMQKIWNIENEKDAFSLIDDILNNDLNNIFNYGIGQILANNILNYYLDDNKNGIKILSNFFTKNGEDSFLKSLNILGLKTTFNDSIVISNESINNLVDKALKDINCYNGKVKALKKK